MGKMETIDYYHLKTRQLNINLRCLYETEDLHLLGKNIGNWNTMKAETIPMSYEKHLDFFISHFSHLFFIFISLNDSKGSQRIWNIWNFCFLDILPPQRTIDWLADWSKNAYNVKMNHKYLFAALQANCIDGN